MALTKNRAKVENLTRNDVIRGIASRFLDIAMDQGYDTDFYEERLEVLCRMMLIESLHIVVHDAEKAIAGVTMHFDWDRHVVNIENKGEFIDADRINQFGTLDSATDTLDAIRTYISGLFERCGAQMVSVWYTLRRSRIAELGEERVDQMIGVTRTDDDKAGVSRIWSGIMAAKSAKRRKRRTVLGGFDEASFEAW